MKTFLVSVYLKVEAKTASQAGNKVYNELGFIHNKPLLGISYIGIDSALPIKISALKLGGKK